MREAEPGWSAPPTEVHPGRSNNGYRAARLPKFPVIDAELLPEAPNIYELLSSDSSSCTRPFSFQSFLRPAVDLLMGPDKLTCSSLAAFVVNVNLKILQGIIEGMEILLSASKISRGELIRMPKSRSGPRFGSQASSCLR
jgi:hypothetical protein